MKNSPSKSEIYKAAKFAAKKATSALQKLIDPYTKLVLADIETMEMPEESSAKELAEKCMEYYQSGNVIISSKIKQYKDSGSKIKAGEMLMFLSEPDMKDLGGLIIKNLSDDEERMNPDVELSAILEMLNIIGNAYISVLAKSYNVTLISMVPEKIDTMKFDSFIGKILNKSNEKVYVVFNTELVVTRHVIKIPFLLAVMIDNQVEE
jgi:chemotaxis protein CheY-P-specific phosphatase CheC